MSDATPPAETADTGGEATPATTAAAATPPNDPTENPTTPPSAGAEGTEAPKATSAFAIPDEYKEKPWAAKIKGEGDLWKQIENLQAAVGKKTVVPDLAKATEEERETYYASLRPNDPAAYGLETIPADVILPSVRTALQEGLLKNGVSPVQAKPILEAIAAASMKEKEAAFSAENFTAEADKVLGKGYDPKPLQATLKSTLTPQTYAALMDGVPNVTLVQVHKAMKEVVDAYGIKESGAHTDAAKGVTKAADPEARSKQLLVELVELTKRPHTAQEKQKLIDERNAIFEQRIKQGA